jgi:serine/threonine protein kinase
MAKPLGPSDTDAGARKTPPPAPLSRKARRGGAGRKRIAPKAVLPKAVPPKAAKPVAPKAVPPTAVPPKAVPPKAVSPQPPVPPKATPPAAPAQPRAAKPGAAKPVAPKAATPPAARKAASPKAAKAAAPAAPDAPKTMEPARKETAPANDPLIGRTLGRCRIEELVGVGKTALVYRAHYEALDDTVAVKILRSEIARNPILVERFQSEARAIARVDNENVLKIYDVGKEHGLYYMVVEFLDGEEVFEVIQREGQVEPMDALRIIRQAANGLSAAHAMGLVHRDIKPQNLFLLEDGTVKVVDFGLATGFDDSNERVGTPHYMAPEVCEHGNAEAASDIYGLGIVLYHLLVGQPPYAGKDIKSLLRAHMDAKPLRVRQRRPSVPKEVSDLLDHLTKRDPLLRPTALDLVTELDDVGGKELKEKDTLKKRTRSSRARSAVARRDRQGKKPVAPILIGLAVAVAAIIIAAVSMGGDDDNSARTTSGGSSSREVGSGTAGTPDTAIDVTPVETPEEIKAREERAFLAERETKSKEAFENAVDYARRTWKGPEDTEAVLSKYRSVISRFKDMSGAAMAKTRIDAIKSKQLHPHPDRELTTASQLEATKELWKQNEPRILEKIAAFDYSGAIDLVPPAVSDETGSFQRELDFWREHTRRLSDFRTALVRETRALPTEDRLLDTPEGSGEISAITEREFEVRIDARTLKFTWPQIGAEAIAALGLEAFTDKGADLMLLQLAFAYAHELKDGFWDAKMTLEATPGAGVHSRTSKDYLARFKARR